MNESEIALLIACCLLGVVVALLAWHNVVLAERSERWEEWFWGHVENSRREQERRDRVGRRRRG